VTDLVDRVAPTFYAAADFSYSTREELWSRAARMFHESPVLGTGFGGWVERIGRIGSRSDLPPHNFLVATWAYSGILAAVLAILFMVVAIAIGLRVVASQRTIGDRRTAVFALCAIAWAFLHGMGDNTGLYGDRQTMILIAIAFGYLTVMQQESVGTADGEIQCAATSSTDTPVTRQRRRTPWRPESASRRMDRGPLRRPSRGRVVRSVAPAKRRPTRRIPERLDLRDHDGGRSRRKSTAAP
jgi:O-antigen ligase